LLDRIEPAGWSDERAREVRARVASVQGHLALLVAESGEHAGPLTALDAAISAAMPDGANAGAAAEWVRFSHQVHPAYEALLRAVAPEAAAARTLRPTNYARNVFHMVGATTVLFVMHLLPNRASLIAMAASVTVPAWTVEYVRRSNPRLNDWMMWLFGPVAHAHERFRANSATWYATAMTILALVSPVPAAMLGVAVLGFGDPFAAIIGRRFGRTQIVAGRTLEGSLAFVLFAWLAGIATLLRFAPDLPNRVIVALVAALFGALAELFSGDLDDNLTIPLGAAFGATTAMWLGGFVG
jgi:dolichol kinase